MAVLEPESDPVRITATMLEEGLGGVDRTLDGSSFAFSTLDLSRRQLQLLHTDEPSLFGLMRDDGAVTGSAGPGARDQGVPSSKASQHRSAEAREARASLVAGLGDALAAKLPSNPWDADAEAEDSKVFGVLAKYRHVRFLDVSRNRLIDLTPVCGMPSLLAATAAGNAVVALPHPHAQRRLRWLQNLDLSFNLLQRLDGLLPRREALLAFFSAIAAGSTSSQLKRGEEGKEEEEVEGVPMAEEKAAAAAVETARRCLTLRNAQPVLLPWLRELIVTGNHLETLCGVGVGTGPLCTAAGIPSALVAASSSSSSARGEAVPPSEAGDPCGCPRLFRLVASSNALGPSLAGIGTCPSLEELYVDRNKLASLGGLFACRSLRILSAGKNGVSSLRALADPTDASHRREWGWGMADGGGGALSPEEGEMGDDDDDDDGGGGEDKADEEAGDVGGGGATSNAALDDEAWEARKARMRVAAAAEEEEAEAFGLPDDRGLMRMVAVAGGLPRDEGSSDGDVPRLLRPSKLQKLRLEDLVKRRLGQLAKAAASFSSSSSLRDPSSYSPPAKFVTVPAEEEPVAVLLPPVRGAGMDPRGADALALERACKVVVAAADSAAEAATARAEAAAVEAGIGLTAAVPFAASLGLVSPGASVLSSLERLDLRDNASLADLRELVWLRALPSLRSIDMRGCPISEEGDGFPVEALIRVGSHLTEINGSPINDVQRRAAAKEKARRVRERAAWRRERAAAFAEAEREADEARSAALAEADDGGD